MNTLEFDILRYKFGVAMAHNSGRVGNATITINPKRISIIEVENGKIASYSDKLHVESFEI